MTNDTTPKLTKIDSETGEEIACTPEETAAAEKAMRDALTGQGGMKIELHPDVLEWLKVQGMTEDELLAMLAETVDAKQ